MAKKVKGKDLKIVTKTFGGDKVYWVVDKKGGTHGNYSTRAKAQRIIDGHDAWQEKVDGMIKKLKAAPKKKQTEVFYKTINTILGRY